ncbi:CsgG/HfaB family protein [Thalassobaculum sp.]|uniref:CsgG/HfaB family protein n=1 Tax=Thalassobaculum sp. TaxID=2022740 RepID=UPI0032EE41E5
MSAKKPLVAMFLATTLSACAAQQVYPDKGVQPVIGFPVTSNNTPYSKCLVSLSKTPATNLPVFAVGDVTDKTGQIDRTTNSTVLSQGVTEMMISAFAKTQRAHLVERYDLRIPLAEARMVQQKLTTLSLENRAPVRASNFVVMGALTELNYNILSEGAGLYVSGIGASGRTVIINVGLDVRVVNSQTFSVAHVSSLQKQIFGYEVEANVFRFFGSRLVEFDAGRIQNEPLQLGVRSVVEMAVYEIMTDFLGLPAVEGCGVEQVEFQQAHLGRTKGE